MPAAPMALVLALALSAASPPRQVPPPTSDTARATELRQARNAILARERARLGAGAGAGAEVAPPEPDGSTRFTLLPEVVPPSPKRPGDPARDESAKALFELANRAATTPPTSYAFADDCLRAVLERQPDHAEARRLLGFVPHQGGWATPFAARMLGEGFVSDPTYGWVKADWVPHLRREELPTPDGKRWLPAAEADALRRDFARGWRIVTEHFRIQTDVPLSSAISFGRKLEALHQLFFSQLADVIGPDQLPLAQRYRVAGMKPTLPKKTHQVAYFATRAEYARHLAPIQGKASQESLGTYVTRGESRELGATSYFFDDSGGQLDVTATLFHEASHQLLFESAGPEAYGQNSGNYWVFEGLGTYFETLRVEPDGVTLKVGGLVGPRIAQARRRLIERKEFLPTEMFVALGEARFKADDGPGDIYLRYAESMALAVYLMQSNDGKFREGFLDYVRDAYKGRLRGGNGRSLEARLGLKYEEIDLGLLDYLGAKP